MISVAAELVGMHPQTLRIYENKGLVRPGRTPGGTRLYSEHDLDRLRLVQRLTTELGLNLAGVARVIALEDELAHMRARLDRLEAEMRDAIEQVHRQYRRDLVVYREGVALPREESNLMDFNKLTIKSQEAVAAAQERARRLGNPELYPEHLLLALLDQDLPRALVDSADELRAAAEEKLAQKPRIEGGQQQPHDVGRALEGARPRVRTRRRSWRTTTSRPSTCCSRSTPSRATSCSRRSRRCAAASASPRRIPRAPTRRWRSSAAT